MPWQKETAETRTEKYIGEMSITLTGVRPTETGTITYTGTGYAVTRATDDKNYREVREADLVTALPADLRLQAKNLFDAIYAWAKPKLLP